MKRSRGFLDKSRWRGFTLIELVIVLALLAILAAMAVAKFVDLSKKAMEIQEDSTVASMRTAVLLYKARYDSWPDRPLFELLDDPPPWETGDPDISDCPNYGNNSKWCTVKVEGGGNEWNIVCPHYQFGAPQRGRRWDYIGTGSIKKYSDFGH